MGDVADRAVRGCVRAGHEDEAEENGVELHGCESGVCFRKECGKLSQFAL